MKLIVDRPQRYAKMRAHTATHLLHSALDKILGGTKQAGSFVDEDYLRFDFTAKGPLSLEQIRQIENMVNGWIYDALDVEIKEMKFDEAIKLGAKAFFEDKYGDIVRVVMVKSNDGDSRFVSVELCGGTHVSNTSQIGGFKIISQEAVASGIRRIVAVTGVKVAKLAQDYEDMLNLISSKFETNIKQLENKIDKFLKEFENLKSENEKLKDYMLKQELNKFINAAKGNDIFDKIIFLPSEGILKDFNFKQIVNVLRSLYGNENFLVYNEDGNFAINFGKKNINAKQFLKEEGLRGGGSDVFVQGKDEKIKNLVKMS